MSSKISPKRIKVVLLEDNPRDAEINLRELRKAGFDPEWVLVEIEEKFLEALEPTPDLIISDFSLPQFDGLRAVDLVRRRGLDIPFILVSGMLGEDAAINAMRKGVDDYLLKANLMRLGTSVASALEKKRLRDEQKKDEEEKRRADERLRLANETLTIETRRLHESQAVANVGSWETDLATLSLTWTEETYRIFETNPEEFKATYEGFMERVHPEDRERLDALFLDSIGEPRPVAIEHRLLFPDGRIKMVEERWQIFKDASGKPVRAVGTCQDITQRKLAERAVTISEASLARAQRIAHMGNWDWNIVTGELYWSVEVFRLFGIDPAQASGTYERFLNGVHPEDRERTHQAVMDAVEGRAPYNVDHRVLWPDGTVRVLHEQGEVMRDAEGRPLNMIGTVQDITERKAAEDLIQTRVRQQEAIAKIGFEATQATALEPLFDFATRAVAAALGVELCKVLQLAPDGSHLRLVSGIGWQPGLIGVGMVGVDRESQAGFTLVSDGPIYVNDFAKETRFKAPPLLKQHQVVSGLSVTIQLRNKPWGVLGAHSRTVRQFNGPDAGFMQTVATLLAVVIERLAVQHTLTESEARMRDAQRIAHLGNWEVDLATNKVNWSEEAFRIFGADPENFSPSYEAFLARVHPDDLEAMRSAHEKAVAGNGPLEIEHRIIRGDGAVRFVRERGELINDEGGAPIALSGTVLDITDLRSAQSEAERMNALLTEAQQIADMGSWELDMTTGRLLWPEETCRLFGIQPEEFGGTFEEFSGLILPEDLPVYSAVLAKSTPTAPLLESEYRIRRPDGTVRWMFERGMVTFDSAGNVTRRLGAVMDITERKAAEEAIRRQARELAETGQTLTAVTEALAAYVERGDWKAAMGRLVRCALEQTQSEYGFIGVVVDSTLRVLAHEGIVWDKVINRDFYEQALRNYENVGYLEFTNFNNLFGRAITTGKVVIANMPDSDARSGGRPSGHPPMRSFLGVPIFAGDHVQGMVALANRPGGYSEAEQRRIETLVQQAGGLCTSYRQREAAIVLEQERVKAEAAVRASESKFRQLADSNVLGIISWEAQGTISDANDAFLQMFGYTREELASGQIDWRNMTPPEFRAADEKALQEVVATGSCTPFEKEYFHKDGRRVAILIGAAALEGAKDRGVCYLVDISQQKQAEATVREAAQFANLRAEIATQLAAPLALPDITRGVCELLARHLDMAFARIWTLNEAEQVLELQASAGIYTHLDGPHARVPVGQFKIGRIAQNRKPHLTNDVSHDTEISDPAWAQREGMVGFAGYPLMIEGRVLGVLGMFSRHAISEQVFGELPPLVDWIAQCIQRKRDEAALSVSEEQLRLLETCVSRLNDLVIITDGQVNAPGPRILYVNDAFVHRTGYAREEVIGKSPRFLQGPKTRRDTLDRIHAALEAGAPCREEIINYSKSGEEYWLEVDLAPITREGKVTHFVAIERDITERKRIQEAIAQSEARFRGLFDQAAVGMCLVSTEGNFLRANARFCEIVGYAPAELLQRDCVATTHPDEREMEAKIVARILSGELQSKAWEKRYVHKAGHAVWCNLTLSLLPGGSGRPPQFVAVAEDITERRAAIEQLRHREQLLRIAGKVARMGGWSVDFPEVRITWSDEVCAIHGVPAGTVPALDQALGFYTPESRPVIESAFSLCASEGTPFDVELEVLTAKGRRAWVRSIGQAERDKAGAIRRVQGAFQDISEQKKAESEALRSAETLAGIVQIQQELASANLAQAEVMHLMAERAQMLTGATGGVVEFAEGSEMVYAVGTGVVADKIGMRLKREGSLSGLAFATGEVLSCEDTETDPRVDLPSCRMIGVRSMIVAPLRVGEKIIGVLKVLSGEPQAFAKRDVHNLQILVETLGVVIQRQRAAEALNSSMEEFRNLAEAMPQIVWTTRPDGWTTYFNQLWMGYTGMTLEESLGHGWNTALHPDDQQMAWDAWNKATLEIKPYAIEYRLRRADGDFRWWLARGEPQKDAAGNVLKWFGTCTDVHSLKIAELEITRTNRALKMLSSCNEALIHAVDESVLLKKICEIAVASGGYRMAWVGYAQDDAKRTIQPMAHAGEEAGYLAEVAISWDENSLEGTGPGGRTIRTGQPNITEDMEQDASFHWRDVAARRGYRSVICLPLRSESRTFGLLGLYSSDVLMVSPDEINLLQELADDLAFGIGHLRARRENERIQSAVLKVATAVSASTGSEFFEQLAGNMAEVLGAAAGFVAVMLPGEPPTARILAGVVDGKKIETFDYVLAGTPCAHLLADEECVFPDRVAELFPESSTLANLGAKAYVGRRLTNAAGQKIGLVYVLFNEPLKETQFITATLRIFAARAASEIERQRAEASVREQAALLDIAHDAIFVKDTEDRIIYWSRGAQQTYGWTQQEALGKKAAKLLHPDPVKLSEAHALLLVDGKWEGEITKRTKDGRELTLLVRWTLVRDEASHPKSILAINTDITERKKLEQQFLRAQRLESIGTLAGGIAHDLNNLLAPILMGVTLLRRYEVNAKSQSIISNIERSAQRGVNLVKQVLSFARGVEGLRVSLEIKHIIREVEAIMESTFAKNITVETSISRDLWLIVGDPTQLHQVLVNLCVNARDAMPDGGILKISATNTEIDEQYAAMHRGVSSGRYVVLEVTDSGVGIPRDIIDRIFEPFFTTKELGRGTGLGLSTVVGIVRSHGGFVNVYSEPGKGSTFRIYLLAQREDAPQGTAAAPAVPAEELPRGNGELILVVDDEETILKVTQQTLESFGYKVVTASDGAHAISIYATRRAEISAVITDMMMPIMDGAALIVALRRINPAVKIIGASGLASNFNLARLSSSGVEHFLAKPYTANVMLTTLQKILAASPT